MPPGDSRARISGPAVGRKHVLPPPIASRGWKLARQRERQPDVAVPIPKIERVLLLRRCELQAKWTHDTARQHRHAVLRPFTVPDQNLAAKEIDVLNAQSDAFHDAHTTAVEEPPDQAVYIAQARQNQGDLLAA